MSTRKVIWFPIYFLFIAAWILGFSLQGAAQSDLEKIVGTWKLVSVESVMPSGEVSYAWMGRNPLGLIMYDQAGNMSVQFMRDPRPTFSSASGTHRDASTEEIKLAYEGYYAYFGTYEINEREGFVIHHVKGSLWPHEVGQDLKRFVKISENRLIITTPPIQRGGKEWFNRITFERVEKGK